MYKEITETMELAIEEIPFSDFPFKGRTEEETTDCWKQFLHDHIDDHVPSTFIVCTTMARSYIKILARRVHKTKNTRRKGGEKSRKNCSGLWK